MHTTTASCSCNVVVRFTSELEKEARYACSMTPDDFALVLSLAQGCVTPAASEAILLMCPKGNKAMPFWTAVRAVSQKVR